MREIRDPGIWDEMVTVHTWSPFLQSWAWGAFQESCGRAVRRFGFYNGEILLALAQAIRYERLGLHYWFIPRGPVVLRPEQAADPSFWKDCLTALQAQVWGGRSVFLRFEPPAAVGRGWPEKEFGLFRRPSLSPSTTRLIDLASSEETLLAQMHTKTRYNIRVAERHGVMVRVAERPEEQEVFFELLRETAARDGFLSQPESYLRKMLLDSSLKHVARIRIAEFKGKALAASLEMVFGDTVTYLHGASSSQDRQLMAPYALHWEAIRFAKTQEYRFYDLWGCNPEDATAFDYKASWEGISRFKAGFGGEIRSLVGTQDKPLVPWLYRLMFAGR